MPDLCRPLLRYFGGKWRLAPWIISHFPPHKTYVEPFGGSASVLLRKPRSNGEIYNDLDNEVFNLFSVLRSDRADDLIRAVAARAIDWGQVVEIGQIASGKMPGRASADEINMFVSQGVGIEDVAIGAEIYKRAKAAGAGEDNDPNRDIGHEILDNPRHGLPHGERHGIAAIRVVEDQPADGTVPFGDDLVGARLHGRSPRS